MRRSKLAVALSIALLAVMLYSTVALSLSNYISVRIGNNYYKPSISSITGSGGRVYVSGSVSAEGGVWGFASEELLNGTYAWTRVFRLGGDTYVTSMALENNTLYIAGVCIYGSRVNFTTKLFILALDPSNGGVEWCREYSFKGHVGSASINVLDGWIILVSSYTNGGLEGILVLNTSINGEPAYAAGVVVKVLNPEWSVGIAGLKPQYVALDDGKLLVTGYVARIYHASSGETIVPNGTFTIAFSSSRGYKVLWSSFIQAGEAVASSSLYTLDGRVYVTGGLMYNVSGLTRNAGVGGLVLVYNESTGALLESLKACSSSGNIVIIHSEVEGGEPVLVGCSITYNSSVIKGFTGYARVFYTVNPKVGEGVCVNAVVVGSFNQSGYSSAIKAYVLNNTIAVATGNYILLGRGSTGSIRICFEEANVTRLKTRLSVENLSVHVEKPSLSIESSSIKLVEEQSVSGGFSLKSLVLSAIMVSVIIAILVYLFARIFRKATS